MIQLAGRAKAIEVATAIGTGKGRFNEIKAATELSSKTLSNLLKAMRQAGVISAKAVKQPGVTTNRFNRYELTEKGRAWFDAAQRLASV